MTTLFQEVTKSLQTTMHSTSFVPLDQSCADDSIMTLEADSSHAVDSRRRSNGAEFEEQVSKWQGERLQDALGKSASARKLLGPSEDSSSSLDEDPIGSNSNSSSKDSSSNNNNNNNKSMPLKSNDLMGSSTKKSTRRGGRRATVAAATTPERKGKGMGGMLKETWDKTVGMTTLLKRSATTDDATGNHQKQDEDEEEDRPTLVRNTKTGSRRDILRAHKSHSSSNLSGSLRNLSGLVKQTGITTLAEQIQEADAAEAASVCKARQENIRLRRSRRESITGNRRRRSSSGTRMPKSNSTGGTSSSSQQHHHQGPPSTRRVSTKTLRRTSSHNPNAGGPGLKTTKQPSGNNKTKPLRRTTSYGTMSKKTFKIDEYGTAAANSSDDKPKETMKRANSHNALLKKAKEQQQQPQPQGELGNSSGNNSHAHSAAPGMRRTTSHGSTLKKFSGDTMGISASENAKWTSRRSKKTIKRASSQRGLLGSSSEPTQESTKTTKEGGNRRKHHHHHKSIRRTTSRDTVESSAKEDSGGSVSSGSSPRKNHRRANKRPTVKKSKSQSTLGSTGDDGIVVGTNATNNRRKKKAPTMKKAKSQSSLFLKAKGQRRTSRNKHKEQDDTPVSPLSALIKDRSPLDSLINDIAALKASANRGNKSLESIIRDLAVTPKAAVSIDRDTTDAAAELSTPDKYKATCWDSLIDKLNNNNNNTPQQQQGHVVGDVLSTIQSVASNMELSVDDDIKSEATSIMEEGKVDALLQDKESLNALIDGIAKLKAGANKRRSSLNCILADLALGDSPKTSTAAISLMTMTPKSTAAVVGGGVSPNELIEDRTTNALAGLGAKQKVSLAAEIGFLAPLTELTEHSRDTTPSSVVVKAQQDKDLNVKQGEMAEKNVASSEEASPLSENEQGQKVEIISLEDVMEKASCDDDDDDEDLKNASFVSEDSTIASMEAATSLDMEETIHQAVENALHQAGTVHTRNLDKPQGDAAVALNDLLDHIRNDETDPISRSATLAAVSVLTKSSNVAVGS